MKQEERKRQTVRNLLEATKELVREQGCQTIKMKDIMERSQLSKGAIFHYVKTKDEIFAMVLQEAVAETHARFEAEVEERGKTFDGPMSRIAESFPALEDGKNVTNQILMYLLGKEQEPAVAEVLQTFYEQTFRYSREWIVTGQQAGVIHDLVDANRMAELLVLISLGQRLRSSIPGIAPGLFRADDFTSLIQSMLKRD